MKKNVIILFLICLITSVYTQTTIKDISFENYPRVDGSTSTFLLNRAIACKLLHIDSVTLSQYYDKFRTIAARQKSSVPFMNGRIQASPTHQAFINLIENKTDIILTTRKMSENEKKYADSLGIKLIETPIALDALIFLANENRGVKSLTSQQIQDIYMGKISRWETIGGDSAILYPYIRNVNTGSQELLENLVMKGLKKSWDDYIVMEYVSRSARSSMNDIFKMITSENQYAIYFTVHDHVEMLTRDQCPNVQMLTINGIEPNRKTITDRTYPYVAELYAVIRSDLPKNDLTYKLYEWIQSKDGQEAIKESGYITITN